MGGTIKLGGSDPLGAGSVGLGGGNLSLEVKSNITLSNNVMLDGGTIAVSGDALTLSGTVGFKASTELDAAASAAVHFNGSFVNPATLSTLTLAGKGAVELNSSFPDLAEPQDPALVGVTVQAGTLILGNSFTGNGSLLVDGGTLYSNDFSGKPSGPITLNSGKIFVGSYDDLGTGSITVQVAADKTAGIAAKFPTDALTNALTLNGGTLTLQGHLDLNGQLMVNAGTLALQAGLIGNAPIVVAGGTLESQAGLYGFKGSITLNVGKINVGAGANLGTGSITVQVTEKQTATIAAQQSATLLNDLTLTGGGTLNLAGNLKLLGAVTLNAGTLNVQGDLIVTTTLQVTGNTEIDLPNAPGQRKLSLKGVTGNSQLTLGGGPATMEIDGDLNQTTIVLTLGSDGLPLITVEKGPNFTTSGEGKIVND